MASADAAAATDAGDICNAQEGAIRDSWVLSDANEQSNEENGLQQRMRNKPETTPAFEVIAGVRTALHTRNSDISVHHNMNTVGRGTVACEIQQRVHSACGQRRL